MNGVDLWLPVWAALSDESLEQRLHHYYALAARAPRIHQSRVDQLVTEARRRGKPEIVERAKAWAAGHKEIPPIQ